MPGQPGPAPPSSRRRGRAPIQIDQGLAQRFVHRVAPILRIDIGVITGAAAAAIGTGFLAPGLFHHHTDIDPHQRPNVGILLAAGADDLDLLPFAGQRRRNLAHTAVFAAGIGVHFLQQLGIQDSRAFSQGFFRWYNEEHRHSGLGLLTPAMVHYNQIALILEQRQTVLDAAYRVHPERFVRQAPKPAAVPTEVWINKPLNSNEITH